MAHKKAGGSSRNGRDSESKRIGVKKFGGEQVIAGNIILRQRGTKWHPGANVGIGTDTPTEKLDVQGNTNISGNIGVGGGASVTGNFDVNSGKFTITASSGDTQNIMMSTPMTVRMALSSCCMVWVRVWATLSMSLVVRERISPRCWESK